MTRPPDPWSTLRVHTAARIALGRVGAALPTREVLAFALDHARARDAVHAQFDRSMLARQIEALRLATIEVESRASDRAVYLRRPDFGRQLDPASRERLRAQTSSTSSTCDIAVVVGDGLSATAVVAHAAPLLAALQLSLVRFGVSLGPVALARGARVALGDEIGELLRARLVVVLIGERPGLSAADSMSAYITFAPRPDRTDAERNCLSNIRPGGLPPAHAASTLAWLIDAALKLGLTGTALKDCSGTALLPQA